jgi:hypothetical protein
MPPTLAKIARALGWPPDAIEDILGGAEPPGGWSEQPSQIGADILDRVMTHAMVTATDNATASEIRAAVSIALDELRRQGAISETDGLQPNVTK